MPRDANDPDLFCYGCAHSAASYPFPSFPSGERPCGFCIRNPEVTEEQPVDPGYGEGYKPTWYDGSEPVRVPMDCYHTVDMKQQMQRWAEARET